MISAQNGQQTGTYLHSPENSLVWPRSTEQLAVAAIKVGKVCINLEDPIGLDEEDAANVDEIASATQKRLALHPRNDIVERPGCDERDDGCREKPAPYRRVEEDEEAVGNGQYKLRVGVLSAGGLCVYPHSEGR